MIIDVCVCELFVGMSAFYVSHMRQQHNAAASAPLYTNKNHTKEWNGNNTHAWTYTVLVYAIICHPYRWFAEYVYIWCIDEEQEARLRIATWQQRT